MTNITFFIRDHKIFGFQSKGHAGYGMRGTDIVCASVSILLVNTINSIEKLTSDRFESKVNDKKATIHFEIDGDVSDEATVLLKSLELGVTEISGEYPGNVSVKYQNY